MSLPAERITRARNKATTSRRPELSLYKRYETAIERILKRHGISIYHVEERAQSGVYRHLLYLRGDLSNLDEANGDLDNAYLLELSLVANKRQSDRQKVCLVTLTDDVSDLKERELRGNFFAPSNL